ncbi:hypothetical protein GLOTRDRAFT_126104 [Gloeophyllum trabeum ATCC 11539]|uniref:CHAT domain-containing protein n=1 Tax=Gloeophyllum trabeum (strain ATCC 11539 / FP-39264 / Madison 617) TaxID=670483 RepID=S7QK94_GLOTA|nr:uncharacterized protein GLOTRDRAFT_126104 [Gloeophyllum trabeum ATCC 11539]EPQ59807.1 hypothetical protein GLOTRDRAFT_126104 [Gloeophyllum trabeum ATCC 11539]
MARFHHWLFLKRGGRDFLLLARTELDRYLTLSNADAYHRALHEAELGVYYHSSFHKFRPAYSYQDGDKAVEYLKSGLRRLTPSDACLSSYLQKELGCLLLCHFERSPNMGTLRGAFFSLQRAMELICRPHDYHGLAACTSHLVRALLTRYNHEHKPEDLDDAIKHQDTVLEVLPGIAIAEPNWAVEEFGNLVTNALASSSTLLAQRFTITGQREDIDAALGHAERAVSLAKQAGINGAKAANCFTGCLLTRFRAYGYVEDINNAEKLVADHKEIEYAASIGELLLTVFERFGDRQYIDFAIRCLGNALNHCVEQRKAAYKRQLGGYDIPTRIFGELLRAHLSAFTTPFGGYEAGAMSLASDEEDRITSQLGRALAMRYESAELRNENDIKEAIRLQRVVLGRTFKDSQFYIERLWSLGVSYRIGYERSHRKGDIERAISVLHEALILASEQGNIPHHVQLWTSLAESLLQRYAHRDDLHDNQDFEQAVDYLRKAATCDFGFTFDRLKAAVIWASSLHNTTHRLRSRAPISVDSEREVLELALEGYSHAIKLLARAAFIGVSVPSRLAQLLSVPKGLASDAAACAFRLHELSDSRSRARFLEKGIELLDSGRTILWSQAAQVRLELERLKRRDTCLSQEFEELARRLGFFNMQDVSIEAMEYVSRTLDQKWEELVDRVRRLQGFEDFLSPIRFCKLQQAAERGVIVVVNVSHHRCDALVLFQNGGLHLVTLEQMTRDAVEDDAKDFLGLLKEGGQRGRLRQILGRLWDTLCSPVLGRLKQLRVISEEQEPPHIRWCLTGKLSFLPIHAAVPRGKEAKGMLDVVISSYIPSLSIFSRAETWHNFAEPGIPSSEHQVIDSTRGLPVSPYVAVRISSKHQQSKTDPASATTLPSQQSMEYNPPGVRGGVEALASRNLSGDAIAAPATDRTPYSLAGRTSTAHAQRGSQYPRVLAVRFSPTSSARHLSHVETEMARLQAHAGSEHDVEIIASGSSMLAALKRCDWVHFACHGKQDAKNPLNSSLALGDGDIPLYRIAFEAEAKGTFAMLLACETAKGSPGFSDEALHIAAGLQFAGFRSVIATMWRMTDKLGPVIADAVYGHMFETVKKRSDSPDGSNSPPQDGNAAIALRNVMLSLRANARVKWHEWATFVHYG